jgi:hypothetical protein
MYAFILCLCCSVYVAALRRADPPSEELYRPWKMITELNKRPGPWMGWKSYCEKKTLRGHYFVIF